MNHLRVPCPIEKSFPLVRSLAWASRLFQVIPRRRGKAAIITVPVAVQWLGEGGRPHIGPTGNLAGVLQAFVTTSITMHQHADIIGIPHATSFVVAYSLLQLHALSQIWSRLLTADSTAGIFTYSTAWQ